MKKLKKILLLLLTVVLMLSGCAMATVDELYCLPKRSEEDENLQAVVDKAMQGLNYCAPTYGENRQVRQIADLDGDGIDEYLLFAKDDSDKPLKILIFCQLASGYVLMDTIEGYGFAYDFVTYAQMDDKPGVELIVGRQVSDQVMRSVSVYRFSSGFARQLMNTSYNEISTTDMDRDGISELFLLTSGVTDKSAGVARFYSYHDSEFQRSEEILLSAPIGSFKQMHTGSLYDGSPAIYVTSSVNAQNLATDVFVADKGGIVSFTKGILTPSIENYYIYPQDMNGDGVLDLPKLLPLEPLEKDQPQQYLIKWYSLDHGTSQIHALTTYHNYAQNWYFELDNIDVAAVSVLENEEGTSFYFRDDKVLTLLCLTDADREEQAQRPGSIVLHRSETVIYVAVVDDEEISPEMQEQLISRFHSIRVELNTEED